MLGKLGYSLQQFNDEIFEHKATDEILDGQDENLIIEIKYKYRFLIIF